MSHPRRMFISSFTLQNGSKRKITPLVLFYLQLRVFVNKIQRFVEYTLEKCFESFVHSAVDARRKTDENTNSRVVAETMKFLVNSSYGCQIMESSQHTVTKYLSDKETLSANNTKLLKKLYHVIILSMDLNSPKLRANTKNQSISSSSFFCLQNVDSGTVVQPFYQIR